MDEFKDLLDKLSGRSKPTKNKIIFVISNFVEPNIISWENIDWLIDDIGSTYLADIIDEKHIKDIPTEIGAYAADLVIHSYQCNRIDDPVEWDMDIWIENIKRIELKYD